jgi:hypothetical protein
MNALIESKVRKELEAYLITDEGFDPDSVDYMLSKATIEISADMVKVTFTGGFIRKFRLKTMYYVHSLKEDEETKAHNDKIREQLNNTDFSKL